MKSSVKILGATVLIASLSCLACVSTRSHEYEGKYNYDVSYGYSLGVLHTVCGLLNDGLIDPSFAQQVFEVLQNGDSKQMDPRAAQAVFQSISQVNKPIWKNCPLPD